MGVRLEKLSELRLLRQPVGVRLERLAGPRMRSESPKCQSIPGKGSACTPQRSSPGPVQALSQRMYNLSRVSGVCTRSEGFTRCRAGGADLGCRV